MPPRRFILFATSLIAVLHAYIGLRILPDARVGLAATAAGIFFLVLSALLIPVGLLARALPSRLGKQYGKLVGLLVWPGLVAIGLFSSLFVLTLLRDVALVPALVFVDEPMLSAFVLYSARTVPVLALLLTSIGLYNARRTPSVVHVDIRVPRLHASLHGLTITQLSDIHVGPTIGRRFIERIVEKVNGIESDLIAITGDLVDGSVRDLAAHVEPLSALKAKYGTYFVTGNHEYYSGAAAWVTELRRLGLRVLENEHVVLEHRGAPLVVAGVTDFSAHQFDERKRSDPVVALLGAPEDAVLRILLAHQPRSADAAERAGFDLQLSGHTHGGQFLPWNFFVRFQQPYVAGLHRLRSMWIYISRGTGYWGPPKRLGAPAEITRLRLLAVDA